jgi:hypothetical protein
MSLQSGQNVTSQIGRSRERSCQTTLVRAPKSKASLEPMTLAGSANALAHDMSTAFFKPQAMIHRQLELG